VTLFPFSPPHVNPGRLILPAAAVLLVASAALAPQRRPEPRTVPELLARLDGMGLCVVTADDAGDLRAGVYLCDHRPESSYAVRNLVRDPSHPDGWEGVVFADPRGETADPLDEWQERSRRVGAMVLYGDPKLLERIDAELRR
jgi:hypothetical protein